MQPAMACDLFVNLAVDLEAGAAGKTPLRSPNNLGSFMRSIAILAAAFCTLLCNFGELSAQSAYQLQPWNPPAYLNGQLLPYAFAGGINAPQVSEVDYNNDGLQDLYIFDRMGDVALYFLNQGQPGQPNYVYQPQWGSQFPALKDWVMLRDYNGDGIQDIFAYGDAPFSGVRVYRGYYTPDNKIAFTRFNFNNPLNLIYIPLASGGSTQLYVSAIDYPAVDDLDCDGDLDIATFNINGGYAEFYKNFSVEMGYQRDSLLFRLFDDCWGGFYESGIGGSQVDLALNPNSCFGNLQDEEDDISFRHAGSTLLTFDGDGDGDKDLLLGDLSYYNLNYLTNGGNCNDAWFVDQDLHFPSYDVTAQLVYFPASFYVDIDDDGRRDLLGAPSQNGGSQDYECLWYYHNDGQDNNPDFRLVNKTLFVDDMIDMGTGAQPFPVDYNADGLLDLVVGNGSFFDFSGDKNARLYLFENTGTPTAPAFTLVDDDYLGFNQYSSSTFSFSPAFGDLDSDGDLDLLVGEQSGRLFYAENTAGAGQTFAFGPIQYGYMGIAIGQGSVPRLIDLNRDGLLDLVVGERAGNINYFQNQGTASSPSFNSDFTVAPNIQALGGVDTRIPGSTIGYSSPWFLDFGQDIKLLTGTNVGRLEWYDNILNNLSGTFTLQEETFGDVMAGDQTQPVMADWNNDGFLDLLVGNLRGGLQLFQTNLTTDGLVNTHTAQVAPTPRLYPNPAQGDLFVDWPVKTSFDAHLFDLNGRLLGQWAGDGFDPVRIPTVGLPAGLYILQLTQGKLSSTYKVILGH